MPVDLLKLKNFLSNKFSIDIINKIIYASHLNEI